VALAGAALFTGCGSNDDSSGDTAAGTSSATDTASQPADDSSSMTTESTGSTDAASQAPTQSSGGLTAASWAEPISTKGDKLGSIKVGDLTVDVYQVAKDKAQEDSMFVNPDTKKNIMPKGSPTVFVNYVVTNNGAKAVPLSNLLVDITATYPDWKYLQGMPGEAHSDVFEKHGLSDDGYKLGTDAPYVLQPGQSFNRAQSYLYQGPKKLQLELKSVPAKPNGDLDSDHEVQATGSVTLK